ncbi:hypothetical protein [Aeromonas hydrophila]|nr:hypothetical protein [Aeromonas hydrophila]
MHEQKIDDNCILLCSDCFEDEGLSVDSYKIGLESSEECPQ